MAYVLVIENKTDHLRVEVSGERTVGSETKDALRVWSHVAETCRIKKINRILVLSEITGQLPIMSAFAIADDPETFGWSRRFKLAIVDMNDDARPGSLFGEDVAANRGFNLKIFDNEPKAKAWLFEKG